MNRTLSLCMNLIKSEICGEKLDVSLFSGLGEEDYKKIYSYSKGHDVVHIVGNALIKNELVSGGIKDAFTKQVTLAVFRYQKLNYDFSEIKKILIENNIDFIPLKGSVLRELYVEPWMRTSCDVDILLKKQDVKKAIGLCEKSIGAKKKESTAHDEAIVTDSGTTVEFHYDLVEDGRIEDFEKPLKDVWQNAESKDGTSEYRLNDETFYYYHLAHMAKHLAVGGCGLRPFIDLWLLRKDNGNEIKREATLKNGGLSVFHKECVSLVDCFFNGKEWTTLDETFANYILDGGVYGNTENRTAVSNTVYKSKFSYILSRIWVPYDKLVARYPNLKGRRILQPFYEIKRWVWIIFGGNVKRGVKELKTDTTVKDEKIEQTEKLFNDLGIKLKK